MSANILYSLNGEYEDWIEDEASSRKIEKIYKTKSKFNKSIIKDLYQDAIESETIEVMDDYGISEEEFDDNPLKMIKFSPILFVVLFLVNWILIVNLSRKKRLSYQGYESE